MIHVSKLNATFLYDQVCQIILEIIKSSSGTVMAVITNNNRTNQAFFKLFNTPESKPWKTSEGIFLLYDYVHLLKSVRINWLTEKTQNLEFEHENKKEIVSWSDIVKLYKLERDALVKLCNLNHVSVFPKPIETQKVSTCLKEFNEKTVAALKCHPGIDQIPVRGTTIFIDKMLSFWKIVSNKEIKGEERHRDPLKDLSQM